ncbi:MAG: DUF5658 family protein, partial [Candidatus Bathyarchaeia archaeon]|nr:DUF5658 family protein [Candidatus Bathyarchaeia archaeon]
PSVTLVMMGTMDWLTTIIGIAYFGAVESNPFMAGLTNSSLITFTVVKLTTTLLMALLFYKAEKTLQAAPNQTGRTFMFTRVILRVAYVVTTALLLAAVVNNLLVASHVI